MRVVFLGTPQFAVPSLRAIREAGHEVALVVTQPDRPARRGQELLAPPVKAASGGLPLLQPEDINAPACLARFREAAPHVLIVVAFGQKLGPDVLSLAPRGCVNAHASLLPRFRGASPIASAILRGAAETGLTLIRLVEKMDAGAMLLTRATPIGAEETTGALEERLSHIAAELLVELLASWKTGRDGPATEQDEAKATYARKLKKEDGLIDWAKPARRLDCLVRAMNPWPVAYTHFLPHGKPPVRVAVLRARPGDAAPGAPLGTIIGLSDNCVRVSTGEGIFDLITLQPENRRPMDARSFVNGWRVQPGDRFGVPT